MTARNERIPASEATTAQPAAVIARVAAISVDGVLLIPTQILGFIAAGNLILAADDPEFSFGITALLGSIVAVLAVLTPTAYFTIVYATRWQASVGKRAMRAAVVEQDGGAPIGLGRSFVRAVLFAATVYAGGSIGAIGSMLIGSTPTSLFVMILLAVAGLFLVPAIARPDGRCLHDLMAGTRVIADPRR